jgi:hypothetical protein
MRGCLIGGGPGRDCDNLSSCQSKAFMASKKHRGDLVVVLFGGHVVCERLEAGLRPVVININNNENVVITTESGISMGTLRRMSE